MKRKIIYTLGLLIASFLPVIAQQDTLTKPDRTKTFQDPKITDDKAGSKVLVDTSGNVADSLLDQKKTGKNKQPATKADPVGTSERPVKQKKASGTK